MTVKYKTIGEEMAADPWKYDDYDGPRPGQEPNPMKHLDGVMAEIDKMVDDVERARKPPA